MGGLTMTMSSGSSLRFSASVSRTNSGSDGVTVTRTTEPKRRRRTPSSMVSSRSSASSSWMAMSASRVTRKGWASTTSMPGKMVFRCAVTSCSSQTKL